ncbi:MAG: hypothetical protein ACRDF0_06640 [Candidatus Limnocylindria bacterium]
MITDFLDPPDAGRMPGIIVDGQNLEQVISAVRHAVERARRGGLEAAENDVPRGGARRLIGNALEAVDAARQRA